MRSNMYHAFIRRLSSEKMMDLLFLESVETAIMKQGTVICLRLVHLEALAVFASIVLSKSGIGLYLVIEETLNNSSCPKLMKAKWLILSKLHLSIANIESPTRKEQRIKQITCDGKNGTNAYNFLLQINDQHLYCCYKNSFPIITAKQSCCVTYWLLFIYSLRYRIHQFNLIIVDIEQRHHHMWPNPLHFIYFALCNRNFRIVRAFFSFFLSHIAWIAFLTVHTCKCKF